MKVNVWKKIRTTRARERERDQNWRSNRRRKKKKNDKTEKREGTIAYSGCAQCPTTAFVCIFVWNRTVLSLKIFGIDSDSPSNTGHTTMLYHQLSSTFNCAAAIGPLRLAIMLHHFFNKLIGCRSSSIIVLFTVFNSSCPLSLLHSFSNVFPSSDMKYVNLGSPHLWNDIIVEFWRQQTITVLAQTNKKAE